MNCALTPKQQEALLIKVYKDLQRIAKSEDDFAINDYVKTMHELISKSLPEDPTLALQYAQLVPEFVNLALTGRKELVKTLRTKGLSRDQLEDTIELFEDIDEVAKIVTPVTDPQDVQDKLDAVTNDEQKPAEPEELSPEEVTSQTQEYVEWKGLPQDGTTTTGQQGLTEKGKLTNKKNPEEDFYYDFFKVFDEAMRSQSVTPDQLVINGHKGFKLKMVKKNQIKLEKARADEQRFVKEGNKQKSPEEAARIYYGGIAAVVSDVEGNILYFDDNYNVVSEEEGKPLYHNLRYVADPVDGVYKARGSRGGANLQTVEEVAANMFLPTKAIPSFAALKSKDPNLHAKLIEKATKKRQAQLKMLHAIRKFLTTPGNHKQSILTDITTASQGILDIDAAADTPINSIDWANSDVEFSVKVADRDNPQLGERKGGLYIPVPGNRSIPFQRNNISSQDIENIITLLFDDVKQKKRKKLTSVPAATKVRLIENLILTNSNGIQVIDDEGTFKVLFKGNSITDVEAAKAEIREFLSTPYKEGAKYNTRAGQYRLKKPATGSTIEEFSVEEGVLKINKIPFEEHVKKNATLEIKPNEENRLVFLNGYFTFSVPREERGKMEGVEHVDTEITEEDVESSTAMRPNVKFEEQVDEPLTDNEVEALVEDKKRFNAWSKDKWQKMGKFLRDTKTSTIGLKNGIVATQKILRKRVTSKITDEEKKVVNETFANVGRLIPQLAAFLAPIPGTATTLQVIKAKSKTIKKILNYTFEALEEYDKAEAAKPVKTEVYNGLPVVESTDIINAEGNKGAAQYDRKNNIIKVDRALLQKKYEEKAWTNMRQLVETLNRKKVKSKAENLPADIFKTYEQFEKFVIEHERQHSVYSREDFNKEYPGGTKGGYETKINERALVVLDLHGEVPNSYRASNIDAVKQDTTPKEKVKEIKEKKPKKKGGLSGGIDLYMERVIPMNSTPEQIEEAKKWFENSPLAKYVSYEEMFNIVNSNAWAEFIDGGIKLYAGSDHTVLYHEAFHAFSQHFLSREEKLRLYEEVANLPEGQAAIKDWAKRKKLDVMSEYDRFLAIEELLAEDFRGYMLSGGKKVLGQRPTRNTIFRKILNFLKKLFGKLVGRQVVTDTTLHKVSELYNNLRVGKINQYSPSVKNAYFQGGLQSTITPPKGQTTDINDQDAMLLVSSMDAIISDIIDTENDINGNTMFTSALFTMPEVMVNEDETLIQSIYSNVKEALDAKAVYWEDMAAQVEGIEKEEYLKRANLLNDAVRNYGDQNSGLMAFHLEKSPYLSEKTKDLDKSAFEKSKDESMKQFDKAGDDLSMMDLASNQVLHLVKSLREYDQDKKRVTNYLGFEKLADYRTTWRQLINTLMDNNVSPKQMMEALQKAAPNEPWMFDLLEKLGDPNTSHDSVFDLWTNFWQAFYLANWKLYQVSVNEINERQEGVPPEKSFKVLVGYASAVFRQVERDFRSSFKRANDNQFIKDTKYGNILSYEVLKKYRNKLAGKEFDFLRDIGIPLADVKEIRDGLKDVRVDFIFEKLERLESRNVPIRDVIKALKDEFVFKDKVPTATEGTATIVTEIPSETSNINKILNLQARHSGLYANTGVSTADGNVKYEQTQMSSLGVLQSALNTVETFQELIEMPHMAHFRYENNPAITASSMLKSLFEFNENTQTYGKRKKNVRFEVDNLSGSQTIVDESYADLNYSTSTAKSDRYTRLLQDIYSSLLGGRFSTMVHADKSTTLSVRVTEVDSGPQSKSKHLYIDPADFLTKGPSASRAVENAYELLLPYLDAELARIKKVTSEEIELDNIPGYTVKDDEGRVAGAELTIFDDVFTTETKAAIIKAGSVENLSEALEDTMLSEMDTYFKKSTEKTEEALGRMMFVDSSIQEEMSKQVGKKLDPAATQELMLAAYTMNTFIHHAESTVLLYGDLAQYNMLKEEFHKRNAGVASTGRMFRTDVEAIRFVNEVLGRPFLEKTLGKKGKKFDATLDTIVLKENTVASVLLPEYTKALTAHYVDRGMTKDAALQKAKMILEPYGIEKDGEVIGKMDEGDAQGWISFDSYRILSKLEGRWSRQQEILFRKVVNAPESVNIKDIVEYFPPRKYQYFGPLATAGVSATAFHKYSLFPLIPSVVKNKNLEVLHKNMMEQDIDYATFDSGSKVSTIVAEGRTEGDVLYSDQANRVVSTDTEYTKNTIFLHYLKDQLDINSQFKGKVIFSTQLRKLIEEGLVEGGVPVDYKPGEDINKRRKAWAKVKDKKKASPFYTKYKTYEDKISKFIEFRKAELRREVGWTEEEMDSGKGDISKLVKFIKKELERQDLSDHEIDFIKYNEKTGELVHDLSISLSASKIERALNAIVNNRLVRQKVNGEALVQLASTLMEPQKATKEQEDKYRTNDLRSYRKGADGKTLPMDVKISLQGDFSNLIHMKHKDGNKIAVYTKREFKTSTGKTKLIKEINEEQTLTRLNETIQDEAWRAEEGNLDMITMTAVRIPVQGLNSMEFMAVWEFLPKEAGNIIIPPSEIVAKSGSDFDIDKLTVMMPSLDLINGQPEFVKEIDNAKTHDQNLERVEKLKDEIKKLRDKKKVLEKEYTEAYENLSKEGLTDEERVELKAIKDEYYTQVRRINREDSEHKDTITELIGKTLTPSQAEQMDAAYNAIERLYNEKEALDAEFKASTKEFGTKVWKKNLAAMQERESAKSKGIKEKIGELTRERNGLSSKAIENTLMLGIRDMLEMPHNFVSLITPNDTSLVKPLAEELSKNRAYKATDRVHGKSDVVSATRILEPAYNIYKHESNAVGKETLGLGAVDNTYNTIFNRVGAYMNPEYYTKKGARRAELLMQHNTMEILKGDHKGRTGISLSHIYGKDGNKIADIINQLMNGWVDVAKDAWIFDIQGNKQVSPVLLFMLQAGVPLDTAVYFVSNPLVKEYVEEQKIATSAYAKAMGENPSDPNFFRSKAKLNVIEKIGRGDLINYKRGVVSGNKLYETTLKMTEGKDFTELAKTIANMGRDKVFNDFNAKAAFFHYLEIEELAKGVRDVKMKLNYDTTKSTTLFDAQRKEADLAVLMADSKFPNEIIEAILNESPIGSFRIAPFQLKLWGPLFKLRNDETLNKFLIDKLSDMTQNKKMQRTYGTEERYVEEFKNDFIVKIFTDAIKSFKISDESYKGLTVNTEAAVESVEHLNRGVVVAPNKAGEMTVYIDQEILDLQFDKHLYSSYFESTSPIEKSEKAQFNYDNLGLAKVDMAAFTYAMEDRRSEYYRFVVEREYQRAMNPFSELSKTHYFQFRVKQNLSNVERAEAETRKVFEERVIRSTYEEILRDNALNNTLNYWKLFMSDRTIADELFEIRKINPTLEVDYNIVNDLIVSEGSKVDDSDPTKVVVGKSYTNLALRDNRVDTDTINVYHKNILDLSDAGINSIPINEGSELQDKIENERIAQFFSNLPVIAFLQSGLNTTDSLSMVRVMPTEKISSLIESASKDVKKKLSDPLEAQVMLEQFYGMFNKHNNPKNISIRRRLKNYVSAEGKVVPNRKLVNNNIEADHTLPMNFTDKEFSKVMNGEVTQYTRQGLDVEAGQYVEFYKTYYDDTMDVQFTRSITVRATTSAIDIQYLDPTTWASEEDSSEDRHAELVKIEGYKAFSFEVVDAEEIAEREDTNILEITPENKNQLESLIKNNPSVIFVLEGSTDPGAKGNYVEGIGKIEQFDNVLPINLRNRLTDTKAALWTSKTHDENIKHIKDSLDKLEELYKKDGSVKLAFVSRSRGYGAYLTTPVKADSTEARDMAAFEYLTSELYSRFGYRNSYSKVVNDVQEMMQAKQDVVEYQIEVPINEIAEARERLTCKI